LALSRLVSFGRLAPRSLGMIPLGTTLTASVRVVHGILCNASCRRTLSGPNDSSGLAPGNILLVEIADLSYGSAAFYQNLTDLSRWELQEGMRTLLRHQLRAGAGAPGELTPFSQFELHIVNHSADRDELER